MRRLIAIAALACLAACSDTEVPDAGEPTSPQTGATATASVSPGASPGATTAPVPSGVPGGAAKDVVCDGYIKAEGDAGAKIVAILPQAAEAMADPSKAPEVLADLKAALTAYEAALKTEASRSADGELMAAIEADAATIAAARARVEAAGQDMEQVLNELNSPEFQKLGEKVKSLCGK